MGAVMLSVRRSKHTRHSSIASVAILAQGFSLPPQTPTASPVDWSEGVQCAGRLFGWPWGFAAVHFSGGAGCGAPCSLESWLLVSLADSTPLCRCASQSEKGALCVHWHRVLVTLSCSCLPGVVVFSCRLFSAASQIWLLLLWHSPWAFALVLACGSSLWLNHHIAVKD